MRLLSLPIASRVRRFATIAATACVAVLTAAPSAHAQTAPGTATIRFDEAGMLAFTSQYGPPDVGRLKATFLSLPGAPSTNQAIDAFCVDLLHDVTFNPSGWNVYLNNLADTSVAHTREGGVVSDALTRYRKAAWLVDQYSTVNTLTDTAGIQGAMWLQFAPTLAPYDYAMPSEARAVASWEAAADAFAGTAAFAAYDWSRFTVLTDVNSVGLGLDDYHGYQELITETPVTATPEPTAVVMLGASLAGIALVARRRGSRAA